jgi:hypothetical protein
MAALQNILLTILLAIGLSGAAIGTTPAPQSPCASCSRDLLPRISADLRQEWGRPVLGGLEIAPEGYKAALAAGKERPLYPSWQYPVKKVYCDWPGESCHNDGLEPFFWKFSGKRLDNRR